MTITMKTATAAQRYADAYKTHYVKRDLPRALQLYRQLLVSDAGTVESAYTRTQVLNIVNAVVPKEELLDANVALALVHLEGEPPDRSGP